jgi:hypothetical protein
MTISRLSAFASRTIPAAMIIASGLGCLGAGSTGATVYHGGQGSRNEGNEQAGQHDPGGQNGGDFVDDDDDYDGAGVEEDVYDDGADREDDGDDQVGGDNGGDDDGAADGGWEDNGGGDDGGADDGGDFEDDYDDYDDDGYF